MPSSWIIRSRVQASAPAGRRLVRTEILDHLLDDEDLRVVVVEAPGGYGKTSLLFDALRERGIVPAWYGVHEHERDGLAFVSYVVEAVQQAFPAIAGKAGEACAGGQTPPERVLAVLLNEIADLHEPVHLVLDDLHRAIDSPTVEALVRLLVESAPPSLRLYLLTRAPLPLPLSRLQANGRAAVLTSVDLAFTADDVRMLFEQVWEQPLSDDEVDLLARKSGGWIAALVLVHIATDKGGGDRVSRLLETLELGNETLFAYLGEEILQTQPPELQRFLKETSILEQFDADAARHVTGDDHAETRMAEIERRTLFLVPVDGQRLTFRYHHLFEAFLRRTLMRECGQEGWRARHRHASTYFEERDPRLSITHALEADDHERAAALVSVHGPMFLRRGWSEQVSRWLEALPASLRDRHPRLVYLAGALDEQRGDWVAALDRFRRAMEAFRAAGDRAGVAEVMETSALCLAKYGDWQRMKDFVAEAHACCAPEDLGLQARIFAWEGSNLFVLGEDLPRARHCLETAYRAARQSTEPEALAAACFSYGFVGHLASGEFEAGVRVAQEGIDLFRKLGNPYVVLHLRMNQAVLLFFAGRLEDAEACTRGDEADSLAGLPFAELARRSTMAKICLERGDLTGCSTWLDAVEQEAVPIQIRPWYLRTLALLQVRQLNRPLAAATVREMFEALRQQGEGGLYAPECYLAAAAVDTWHGDFASARVHAETALDIAERIGMPYWRMKAHAWLAFVEFRAGRPHVDHLESALRITREAGYRAFWSLDFAGFTAPLLVSAIAEGREADEATEILVRAGAGMHARLAQILQGDRPEREKDVVVHLLGEVGAVAQAGVLAVARRRGSASRREAAARALEKLAAVTSRIEIRTLGTFAVLRNGQPVALPRRTPRCLMLLKLMLSRPSQAVQVDEIIEALWQDLPLDKARKNLRMQTLHLRDFLVPERRQGDEAHVLVDGDTCRLDCTGDLRVDFLAFEQALSDIDSASRQCDLAGAREAGLRAESLYAGPFLPDDVYVEFTEPRRRSLAERHLRCLVELGDAYTRDDLHEEAMPWYKKALEIDRSSERTFQKLLFCYLRVGDRAAAARDCRAFIEHLRRDLEVEPTARTQALMRDLLEAGRPT